MDYDAGWGGGGGGLGEAKMTDWGKEGCGGGVFF